MENSEDLAQEALKFLELAQELEEKKDLENAIAQYRKAADFLKRSGFLMHRLNDVYERIEELTNYLKQDQIIQRAQVQTQIEKLQDQAFSILEGAKKLEFDGFFEDAIEQYNSAITLLTQAGWSGVQLYNLELKIKDLRNELERQKIIKEQEKEDKILPEQQVQLLTKEKPQVVGIFGETVSADKAKSIDEFRIMKKHQEDLQKQAFTHIDKAKISEKEKKFDTAILNYEQAIDLLNSIGWDSQTQNIQTIIQKLKKEKEEFEAYETQQKEGLQVSSHKIQKQKDDLESATALKQEKLTQFEKKKNLEEQIQVKAFNLIDIGNRLERKKEYDQALEKFEEAIQLLTSIEWDSYIQPILKVIDDIKKKQKREKKAEKIKENRQKDLMTLQESIYLKQREQTFQSSSEQDTKKKEYEEKRKREAKKENQLYLLLDEADTLLKGRIYDEAIDKYQGAIKKLEELGPNWATYATTIKNTLINVKKLKEEQLKKEYDTQKKLERREQEEIEFQKHIDSYLKKEREHLEKREIVIKEDTERIKYFEQRKNDAFKILDSASNYLKQAEYENAILAYQEVGNIYAEIQWVEEIPIIEESIREVENLQKMQKLIQQKKMQAALDKQKEEEEFQNQIGNHLKQEREKLKKKQIELREYEQDKKFREEQRKSGFKLLAEAQENVNQGNFNKAIEILQYAINFFTESQWENEINLIQSSIVEIENKKREAELQKQIKLQAELEREKQERSFHEFIKSEMKAQREDLKQKEIVFREREKEFAYREIQKEEAFKLLDKAQDFLSQKKYDDALEIYYMISSIFAQIQWTEEIPIIQEAINEIKNKRKENNISKQELLQISIKKESSDKAFLEQIKYYREREKIDTLKEEKLIKEQKQISSQNLVKQQKAFKMIEVGESLIEGADFNRALDNYLNAITLLKEIGWGVDYLKSLHETIDNIKQRASEYENDKKLQYENALKQQKEEELFQKKISDLIHKEKARFKNKEFKIKKKEVIAQKMEVQRSEAFNLLEEGEKALTKGNYDEALEKYRQAELNLNEINFSTGVIRETIYKIQEKKREEDLNKFKEGEAEFRREQDEILFQKQITERIKLEEQKMKVKQENLRKQEELKLLTEQKEGEAFDLLGKAQEFIEQGMFDTAIDYYQKTAEVFKEIQWDQEVDLIKDSIMAVEEKKRESELKKQVELKVALDEEKQEQIFQERLVKEMNIQRETLKQKEIHLREEEKELECREIRKIEAFKFLDNAQDYLLKGKFDEAIKTYREVTNIFAQIQWVEDIPILQEAIRDIENRKREEVLKKQKLLQDAIQEEKANFAFMEQIRHKREEERAKSLGERELLKKKESIGTHFLTQQQNAFKLIDDGYVLLNQQKYDEALENYRSSSEILTEIGWTPDYLKLLKDTIQTIEIRKRELEIKKEQEKASLMEQQNEEEQFQKKVSDYMDREQKRLKEKEFEILKREETILLNEHRKKDAFELMDGAEKDLNLKNYQQAEEKYLQAELILNEIGFPTLSIKEMISKIQDKNKEEIINKQKQLENALHREREEQKFQQNIKEIIKLNGMKLKAKQNDLERRENHQVLMERRKEEAFDLLEEAEVFMKKAKYDRTLDYYHRAESTLNEIGFPTQSIREMISKVQEKKRQQEIQKQKDLEAILQKEKEEWQFQQRITTDLNSERERLTTKQLKIQKLEQTKLLLEERKKQAFSILDEAETLLKSFDYDNALRNYRKAEIMLNEFQFPTNNIKDMMHKIKNLKIQKEESEDLEYQRKLDKLEEDRSLKTLIEERKRQEAEKKKVQQLAHQERKRIIEEQRSARESAFSLLDKAGKYLKQHTPDYNNAISLYIQARYILTENVGWEPEINNLNMLIKDLQEEQANFIKKRREEEQARFERQKEYEQFREEGKRRRLEQAKLKQEQERQFRKLVLKKQQIDQIKDAGLRMIDEGKRRAAHHDFQRAYKNLNMAISKFKEIGWDEEIKYIETEIKNTKLLEQRVKTEEVRIQQIQEQLEKQRILEERRRESEFTKLKETKEEVSHLADEVMIMIQENKEKQDLDEKRKKEKIKHEAKEFSKEMGQLIIMKEELLEEISKKEEKKSKQKEKQQVAEEREKIDDLKKMIKDAAKKNN